MSDENSVTVYEEEGTDVLTYLPFIKIEQDGSILIDGEPSDQDIISEINVDSAKVLVLPYQTERILNELGGQLEENDEGYTELIEEMSEGVIEGQIEESDISETMLHDHNYEDGGRADPLDNNYTSCDFIFEPVAQNRFQCEVCAKAFNTPASLKRHIRTHTGERPFQCQICEKYFSQQSNLWKHVRTHTGERPFECPHCNKRFSQRANMKKHLVIHTGERPFVCFLCSRAFTQQANLSKHMRLHTGEKPFSCTYCEKSFTQRSNLQKHEHLHEGIKPYTCEICFQAFTQQSNLKKHEMMHKNVRKYVCDICLKSYVQKVSLIKHRQRCSREREGNLQYVVTGGEDDIADQELIKQYEEMEEHCLDFEEDIEEEPYEETDSSNVDQNQETQSSSDDCKDIILMDDASNEILESHAAYS